MPPLPLRYPRMVLLVLVLLPACFSFQPRSAELTPKADVLVQFAAPRTVTVTTRDRAGSSHTCQATRLRGRVSTIAGETITLVELRHLEHATPGPRSCLSGKSIRFERAAADVFNESRFDAGRVGVLAAVFAVLVGFAAYAASQI